MVRLIFSLDTEDYITPEADEADRIWAKILIEKGIKGCFNLVGEKARVLRQRGERKLIDLLKKHEINYHSNFHSIHPTFSEYLEDLDWDEGVKRAVENEIEGLRDVIEIFDKHPVAFMQPGDSWGPQVIHAMVLMGIPVMEWTFLKSFENEHPCWYCNSLNGLTWNFVFDDYFEVKSRAEKMRQGFIQLYNRAKKSNKLIILGTHPCRLVTREFWDEINFPGGCNTPRDKWKPAPLRSPSFVKELVKDIQEFIAEIVKRKDIEVITYSKLHLLYKQPLGRWFSLKTIMYLAERIKNDLSYQTVEKESFSLSEIFSLFIWSLAYFAQKNKLPEEAPVRQILGPISDSPKFEEKISVNLNSFLKICKQINNTIEERKRIPSFVEFNGARVGPTEFLKAMTTLLLGINGKRIPSKLIIDSNQEAHLQLLREDDLAELEFQGRWLFRPGFKGSNLIKIAKLQSWTLKPAIPTCSD